MGSTGNQRSVALLEICRTPSTSCMVTSLVCNNLLDVPAWTNRRCSVLAPNTSRQAAPRAD